MAEITDNTLAMSGAGRGYGYGRDYGNEFCALQESVIQTRADIRESIQNHALSEVQQLNKLATDIANQGIATQAGFTHVGEKACDAEKEAIKAGYEAKLQTLTSANGVEKAVESSKDYISDKITGFEQNVNNRFCEVDKAILTQGYENRLATAGVLAAVREDGSLTRSKVEECCCELKGVLASNKLQEVQDELTEARFDAILAKCGASTGHGNGNS